MRTATHQRRVEYTAARVHARHGRRMDAGPSAELVRLQSVSLLAHALHLSGDPKTSAHFQEALEADLEGELGQLARELGGVGGAFLEWLATRRAVEALDVLLRDCCAAEEVPTPHEGNRALEELAARLPEPIFRHALEKAVQQDPNHERPWPCFLELALERAYLVELAVRGRRLPAIETEVVLPMIRQEVDLFHLRLLLHAKAMPSGNGSWLREVHLNEGRISRDEFEHLLGTEMKEWFECRTLRGILGIDATTAAGLSGANDAGHRAQIERFAWRHYGLLARRAWRRSHVGVGALAGYAVLRRLEMATWIAVSEGIRWGLDPGALGARMFSGPFREVLRA